MKYSEWGDQLEKLFIGIGLTEKESRVYRILLDAGELTATEVVRKSNLKRGITYAVLYKLIKDGLVMESKKGSKSCFRPESPQKLYDMLEQKKTQVDYVAQSFTHILPKLISQYKLAVGKPTIQYFEGNEGLKAVLDHVYSTDDKHIWGCVDIESAEEALMNHILPNLMPRRIKNKIWAHSISAHTGTAEELASQDKKHLREQILVNRKKYPLPAEIEIYGDNVAMLSFIRHEFIGVIFTNKDFAQSLKSICRLAMDLSHRKGRRHSGHHHI